jgi:hypothetical protein
MSTRIKVTYAADEMNNFKQYPEESLLESFFRIIEVKNHRFYSHAQIHIP